MSAITYFDCPVSFASSTAGDKFKLVASQASIEESIPLLPIKSLGRLGPHDVVPDDTRVGTVSISYIFSFGANSPTIAEILGFMPINRDEPQEMYGKVGKFKFSKAYITNFTIESQALSIARATLTFTYFNSEKEGDRLQVEAQPDQHELDNERYSQGIHNVVNGTTAGLSENLFSFNLNVSVGYQPVKVIGELDPIQILKTDGTATINLVGNDLPEEIFSADKADGGKLCISNVDGVSFTLRSCDTDSESVSLPLASKAHPTLYISNRQVAVSENGVLEGTATCVQYF